MNSLIGAILLLILIAGLWIFFADMARRNKYIEAQRKLLTLVTSANKLIRERIKKLISRNTSDKKEPV